MSERKRCAISLHSLTSAADLVVPEALFKATLSADIAVFKDALTRSREVLCQQVCVCVCVCVCVLRENEFVCVDRA